MKNGSADKCLREKLHRIRSGGGMGRRGVGAVVEWGKW